MVNSGAFFFSLSSFMTALTVSADGRAYDANGIEQDALDPFAPVATRRAVTSILTASGHRTRLDVLTAVASAHVQANLVGRNAPVTVATLLIRMGKDDIVDAMVQRFAEFTALEAAA